MEADAIDELGVEKRGILARHKFASDEQCVFVKLSVVPISHNCAEEEKEEEGAEDEVENAQDSDNTKLLTVQIEYVDGDNFIQGLWNHDTLCFEGKVKTLSSDDEHNEMGGTIISGLISGHSGYINDGSVSREGNTSRNRTRAFSLSPCTHLHTHGISPTPCINSAFHYMLANNPTAKDMSINEYSITELSTDLKTNALPADKQLELLDELSSSENHKLVLHRSRTETLRREALVKLCDLGQVVDFAELARKRNIAKRRKYLGILIVVSS